jgi:hypothetical protein
MIVDCNECSVRGRACGDCVVTVLLGMPGTSSAGPPARSSRVVTSAAPICLEQEECQALGVLAAEGLIPRLRLVTSRIPAPESKDNDRATKSGEEHIL